MIIQPNIPLFDKIDYSTAILPSFPTSSKIVEYNTDNGEITFTFTYDNSLNTNQNMTILF